ncbi:adhesin [Moraxella catarrhalis]|uniref:adhesin n=1 Tax=Moraxella catarrhalis TaxID=480 RepID=UPI000202B23A|nr:moraxella IgD binding protein/hemagglutinin MID/Hag [Moraxella catarrhalis 101P30B1]
MGSSPVIRLTRVAALAILAITAMFNSTTAAAIGGVAVSQSSGTNNSSTNTDTTINAHAEGNYAVAVGKSSHAKGNQSIAIGGGDGLLAGAEAKGEESIAIGGNVRADGDASIAIGSDDLYITQKAGGPTIDPKISKLVNEHPELKMIRDSTDNKVKFQYTQATGHASIAAGTMSKASGAFSNAFGTRAEAEGHFAVAVGLTSRAKGKSTVALGSASKATGDQAIAIGSQAHAEGIGAIAIGADGSDITANNTAQTESRANQDHYKDLVGKYLQSTNNLQTINQAKTNAKAGAIAIGTQAFGEGVWSNALGVRARSQGFASTAIGTGSWAQGGGSLALGAGAKAIGKHSVAIGVGSTTQNTNAQSSVQAYDPSNNTLASNTKSTVHGEVSVGSHEANNAIRRRITNVGAGASDTDAVNVAQLKAAVKIAKKKTKVEAATNDSNITVNSSTVSNDENVDTKYTVQLSKNLQNLTSVNTQNLTATGSVKVNSGTNTAELQNSGLTFSKTSSPPANSKTVYGVDGLKFTNSGNTATVGSTRITDEKIGFAAPDGTVDTDAPYLDKKQLKVGAVKIDKDSGIDAGNQTIKNVKSTLMDTANTGTTRTVEQGNIVTSDSDKSNAASIKDVLNAGFNLKNNDTSVDFVSSYDTINFADGEGTTAKVAYSNDGGKPTNKVTYDVNVDDKTIHLADNSGKKKLSVKTTALTKTDGTNGNATTFNTTDDNALVTAKNIKENLNALATEINTTKNTAATALQTFTVKKDGDDTSTITVGKNTTNGDKVNTLTLKGDAGINITTNKNGTVTFGIDKAQGLTTPKLTVGDSANGKTPLVIEQMAYNGKSRTIIKGLSPTLPKTTDDVPGVRTTQQGSAISDDNKTHAASIGDVLNAGFNLQGNGKAVDFVSTYDTVNFINGNATTATVTYDNTSKTSKVAYDVNVDEKTLTLVDGQNSKKQIGVKTTTLTSTGTGNSKFALNNQGANSDNGDALVKASDIVTHLNTLSGDIQTAKGASQASNSAGYVDNNGNKVIYDSTDKKYYQVNDKGEADKTKEVTRDKLVTQAQTPDGALAQMNVKSIIAKQKENDADGINEDNAFVKGLEKAAKDPKTKDAAVTVNDLHQVASTPITFKSDDGVHSQVNLGDTFAITGGADYKNLSNGKNIGVISQPNGVQFKLARDLTDLDSVSAGGTKIDEKGVSFVEPNGQAKANTPVLSANGLDLGGKVISNVGDATQDTDAINKKALDAAKKELKGEIGSAAKTAQNSLHEFSVADEHGNHFTVSNPYSSYDTSKTSDVITFAGENGITTKVNKGVVRVGIDQTKGLTTPKLTVGNNNGKGIVIDSKDGQNTITGLSNTLANVTNDGAGHALSQGLADNTDKTRAASIGDVLNAGFNLQGNGEAVDFVSTYDTVDFIDGNATTAKVTYDDTSKTSTVVYDVNVDDTTIEVKDKKLGVKTTTLTSTGTGANKFALSNQGTGDALVKASDIVAHLNTLSGDIQTAKGASQANNSAGYVDADGNKVIYDSTDNKYYQAKNDGTVDKTKEVAKDKLVAQAQTPDGTLAQMNVKSAINKEQVNDANKKQGINEDNAFVKGLEKAASDNKTKNAAVTVGDLNAVAQTPLTFAGDTGTTAKKLGETLTIKGGQTDTNKLTDNNIGVVAGTDGFTVKLAKDLTNLNSVNAGGTKIDDKGVSFVDSSGQAKANTPVLSANGLDLGGKVISNVGKGTKDTDAANVQQLNEVRNLLGLGNAGNDNADGNQVNIADIKKDPNSGSSSNRTVIKAGTVLGGKGNNDTEKLATGGIQVGVDKDGNANGDLSNVWVKTQKDGSKKALLATYNVAGQTNYLTNNPAEAIDRINEQGIRFFHVNDGNQEPVVQGRNGIDSSASGKHSVAIGFQAKADGEAAVAIGRQTQAGSQSIAIGDNAQATGDQSIAIGTGNVVAGKHSGAIGDPSTVKADNSYSVGNNNQFTDATQTDVFGVGNNITVTESNSVALGSNSAISAGTHAGTQAKKSDGTAGTTTTAGATGTVKGFAGQTAVGAVSVGASGAERRIQNVAAGEVSATSTDAVNGSQLYKATQSIANATNELDHRIHQNENKANAGISSAMAMASMPQAYIPGRSMVTGGIATHNGQGAVAVGLSKLSDNGQWVFKINGSADTQGHVGAAVGAGFHF